MARNRARVEEPKPEEEAPRRRRVPRGGIANTKKDTEPDSRSSIKYRLGKRWSQIILEVQSGEYTWEEFCSELDPEELARGQLKDRNGTFAGRPPAMVPRAFQQSCVREIQRRFNEKVQARLLDAVDEMIDLSKSGGGLEGKDRAKLLVYLIERVMGPVPKQIEIRTGDEGWQGLVTQGFVRPTTDGSPAPSRARSDRYAKRRNAIDPNEDDDD
jgi:hypothetical protein